MIKKIIIRLLHHIARHGFPSGFRVFVHRLRGINIGKNVYMGIDVHLDDDNSSLITIDDNVFIAPECMILTHKRDMKGYKKGMWVGNCPFTVGSVTIKNGAHIGTRCLIFPGVTIGEGAVIAANSLVTKDVPPYSLAMGVPAKVIKTF